MSQHDSYINRMTVRLQELEEQVRTLRQNARPGGDTQDHQLRDLEVSCAAAKERLQELRRAGPDCNDEMIQAFARNFDRLNAAVGRAMAGHTSHTHAA